MAIRKEREGDLSRNFANPIYYFLLLSDKNWLALGVHPLSKVPYCAYTPRIRLAAARALTQQGKNITTLALGEDFEDLKPLHGVVRQAFPSLSF